MTTRNRKIAILVIAILLVALAIIIYRRNQEVQQPMVNLDKFGYTSWLEFDFRIILNDNVFSDGGLVMENIIPSSDRFDPSFTELVLVHNEAESVDFPDNVIAAWPRESNVEGLIVGFHWAVNLQEEDLRGSGENRLLRRPVITLDEFGLTYPLTVKDLVSNWEKVFELWRALGTSDQSTILNAAHHGGPDW